MKIPDKAFDITMSKPYLNDANILVVDVKCKPNDKFIKHFKLMKHKKFRIAKKNAKKLAELIDAKFYKDENNNWVVEANAGRFGVEAGYKLGIGESWQEWLWEDDEDDIDQ